MNLFAHNHHEINILSSQLLMTQSNCVGPVEFLDNERELYNGTGWRSSEMPRNRRNRNNCFEVRTNFRSKSGCLVLHFGIMITDASYYLQFWLRMQFPFTFSSITISLRTRKTWTWKIMIKWGEFQPFNRTQNSKYLTFNSLSLSLINIK